MKKKYTNNELHDIAPQLNKIEKGNPFAVPANYFQELPQSIQQRVSQKKKPSPAFSFFAKPGFVLSGITTMLVILFAGYFYFSKDITNELNNQEWIMDELAWYSEYQTDVYYDMVLSMEEEELEANSDTEISDELIIEYLLDYSYYLGDYPDVVLDTDTGSYQ
jgi:hypothetical protein